MGLKGNLDRAPCTYSSTHASVWLSVLFMRRKHSAWLSYSVREARRCDYLSLLWGENLVCDCLTKSVIRTNVLLRRLWLYCAFCDEKTSSSLWLSIHSVTRTASPWFSIHSVIRTVSQCVMMSRGPVCDYLLWCSVNRLLFGTLFPAYSSYKAVKTKNVREYVSTWLRTRDMAHIVNCRHCEHVNASVGGKGHWP